MKTIASLFTFLIAVLIISSHHPASRWQTEISTPQDSIDVLQAVKALQDSLPAPPTQFRPGHVSPRNIEGYLKENDGGFTIQLPKPSLTPSPTVYKDLLLVSGGFGSKEFYAFDAQSGAVKWAIDLDDDGPSSAVIEDDIAVFNTESCTVFACDVFTGEMLWSHYLGDPLMSTPSIANGTVYTAYPANPGSQGITPPYNNVQQQTPSTYTPDFQQKTIDPATATQPNSGMAIRATHVFIALDLQTGKIRWQKWIDGDVMSAPVIEGNNVYATTFPGTLYKFDAASGEILAATASRATSAPVIAGKQIFLSRRADKDSTTVAENLSILSEQLSVSKESYTKEAPYLDEKVQSSSHLKMTAMNYDAGNGFTAGAPANSGWAAASFNIGQSNVSSLQAFQGSRILHHQGRNYATMGDELVCTNPETGQVYWQQPLTGELEKEGGFLATPPLTVDNKIIIASLTGDIIIYHAGTGREWKRFSTGEQVRFQPVLDKGRLYVSTVSGQVFCFDTGRKKLTGWPTWGANAAHSNKVN